MKRNHRTLLPRSYKLLSNVRERNMHVRRVVLCLLEAQQDPLGLSADQAHETRTHA